MGNITPEGFTPDPISNIEYSEFIDKKQESDRLQTEYRKKYNLTPQEAFGLVAYTYAFNIPPESYKGNIRVLDAGSNTGAFKDVLKAMGYETEVVNIDYASTKNVDVMGDIEKLPFADNTFDQVVASWAIPDLVGDETRRNLFANEIEELLRVTKKGGTMRFSPIKIYRDYGSDDTKSAMEEIYNKVLARISQLREKYPDMKVRILKAKKVGFIQSSETKENEDYDEILEIVK